MKENFSTRILCSDSSGALLLKKYDTSLTPGEPFSCEENRVILSGGFGSLSPETTQILSPTLQLNSDIGDFSEKQLLTIAEAELKRNQSLTINNYEVEVDPRVCVIADDVSLLDDFADTYGGLLEIEPLLLKGVSTEYPVITELSIEEADPGYRVKYRKHAPIKFDVCTYCGECGRACPEKCISPHLHIDFSSCTYCKECEKVCKYKAVDIHSVEETVFRIPAIIVLGKLSIELPENKKMIFQGNQVSAYLKTLYSYEIKEVVCHNNNICQYSGRLGIGCGRCVDSCPHGALKRNAQGIAIDHVLCEACGNCVAVCPTGAMQNGNFKDEDLLKYLGAHGMAEGAKLVIGGESELHTLWWDYAGERLESTLFLEYDSIRFLSYYHLLTMFSHGFSKIVLLGNGDIRESKVLAGQVERANAISNALFSYDCVQLISTAEFLLQDLDKTAHPLTGFLNNLTGENRKENLSHILQAMLSASGKELSVEESMFDFTMITCSEGCTHCFACLNECKTRALRTDENSLTLDYAAGLCVGCGVCVGVCPEKVLGMKPVTVIDNEFFTEKQLAKTEPALCKGCGKVFGTRKALDRVMQILSSKEAVNTDHFEYCGECRVVNLFEAQKT